MYGPMPEGAYWSIFAWHVHIMQELFPVHSQQLPREETGGAAVDGLPHGDDHVRGPPHALSLQRRRFLRRPHRLLQLLLNLSIPRPHTLTTQLSSELKQRGRGQYMLMDLDLLQFCRMDDTEHDRTRVMQRTSYSCM